MRKANGKLYDSTCEYFNTIAEMENRKRELLLSNRYDKATTVRLISIEATVNKIGGLGYRLTVTRATR